MTREEAIQEIINLANNLQIIPSTSTGQAVLMAVKSLEAWEKVRAEVIAESKKNYTNSIFNKGLYRAIEIIDKYSEVSE